MGNIKIVTDSASSIPQYLIDKLDIAVVDIPVHRGEERIPTDTLDRFYELLENNTVPTTSAPPPGDFYQVYKELSQKYRTIISIHISGKVSGTYQSAVLAREMLPEEDIVVIDSENISMATGFLVLAAARAAASGQLKEDIIKLVEQLKTKVGGLVAIPTLKFLAKSGRISHAKALMGNILSVKPILIINAGEVKFFEKTRSFEQALKKIIETVKERVGTAKVNIAVMHTNTKEKATEYMEYVQKHFNYDELFIADLGPGLAVHGGPGMLGIVWISKD